MQKREEGGGRIQEEQQRNNITKDKTTDTAAERTWPQEIREGGNEGENNKEETTHSVFITITTPKEPIPQPRLTQKKKAQRRNKLQIPKTISNRSKKRTRTSHR